MGKTFLIEREVELKADPDAVFRAVATGEGIASWMFPEEITPGVGSETADGGKVTAWDPPHDFAVRAEGPDGWFNELRFRIEARGDGAILRYVHSSVIDEADWDDQYDAVQHHTDFYLHTLGQYLEHFSPRTATYVGGGPGGLSGPEASMTPDAFTTLQAALGVPEDAGVGDSVRLDHADGDGVIDYRTEHFLGVRTDDALYRFFGRSAWGGPVGMSIHHFGADVDAERVGAGWTEWIAEAYSTPGPAAARS
jgi:uncharacterized protein YndB with AHSA1/START domain